MTCWLETTSRVTKTDMDSNCWKRPETCQHWSAHRVAVSTRSCWLEELCEDSNAPLGACHWWWWMNKQYLRICKKYVPQITVCLLKVSEKTPTFICIHQYIVLLQRQSVLCQHQCNWLPGTAHFHNKCKKLNSLKQCVRTTLVKSHN